MSDPIEYEPVTEWDWILETWHQFVADLEKTAKLSKDAAAPTAAMLVIATILADWPALDK